MIMLGLAVALSWPHYTYFIYQNYLSFPEQILSICLSVAAFLSTLSPIPLSCSKFCKYVY